MVNMQGFHQPVHRSLLQRDLLGGVPQAGLFILFFMAVIFVYGLEMPFMLVPIVLLYFVMRALTKMDAWLIDIVLDNIQQRDVFIP
jgi:type IV secretory pathway VirB3-like protein